MLIVVCTYLHNFEEDCSRGKFNAAYYYVLYVVASLKIWRLCA